MPRRNGNAKKRGNRHSKAGSGWMHGKRGEGRDRAPLTPGQMHSKTRLR